MTGYRGLGARPAVATAWVTAADITGTGTSVVNGAYMELALGALPDFSDLRIEIQFSQARTAGDSFAITWAHIPNLGMAVSASASGGNLAAFYTSQSLATTIRSRRIVVAPLVIGPLGDGAIADDIYQIRLMAKAGNAGTSFAVTNIRSRLIYTPL